ncbi:hypothetical protein cypCar_00014437 [Cyprinus carpio]|nr:hypothetical protein cypCar_00014437 [Cyprinus carpio]
MTSLSRFSGCPLSCVNPGESNTEPSVVLPPLAEEHMGHPTGSSLKLCPSQNLRDYHETRASAFVDHSVTHFPDTGYTSHRLEPSPRGIILGTNLSAAGMPPVTDQLAPRPNQHGNIGRYRDLHSYRDGRSHAFFNTYQEQAHGSSDATRDLSSQMMLGLPGDLLSRTHPYGQSVNGPRANSQQLVTQFLEFYKPLNMAMQRGGGDAFLRLLLPGYQCFLNSFGGYSSSSVSVCHEAGVPVWLLKAGLAEPRGQRTSSATPACASSSTAPGAPGTPPYHGRPDQCWLGMQTGTRTGYELALPWPSHPHGERARGQDHQSTLLHLMRGSGLVLMRQH